MENIAETNDSTAKALRNSDDENCNNSNFKTLSQKTRSFFEGDFDLCRSGSHWFWICCAICCGVLMSVVGSILSFAMGIFGNVLFESMIFRLIFQQIPLFFIFGVIAILCLFILFLWNSSFSSFYVLKKRSNRFYHGNKDEGDIQVVSHEDSKVLKSDASANIQDDKAMKKEDKKENLQSKMDTLETQDLVNVVRHFINQ